MFTKPIILKEYWENGIRYYKAKKNDGTKAIFQADIFDDTWNCRVEKTKGRFYKGKNPNTFNELIEEND